MIYSTENLVAEENLYLRNWISRLPKKLDGSITHITYARGLPSAYGVEVEDGWVLMVITAAWVVVGIAVIIFMAVYTLRHLDGLVVASRLVLVVIIFLASGGYALRHFCGSLTRP